MFVFWNGVHVHGTAQSGTAAGNGLIASFAITHRAQSALPRAAASQVWTAVPPAEPPAACPGPCRPTSFLSFFLVLLSYPTVFRNLSVNKRESIASDQSKGHPSMAPPAWQD
jgi:hypothetical protein